MTLPQVGGGENMTGMMYFCCAPCVCDTYDFIEVDTKTITTKDGPKQYHFVVIGNPCLHPESLTEQWSDPFSGGMVTLQQRAPDVKCSGTDLEKATFSDHGHIILSMFFESGTPGHATSEEGFQDSVELQSYCLKRAEQGYNSGMGEIFRKVALISPLDNVDVSKFTASTNTISSTKGPATSSGSANEAGSTVDSSATSSDTSSAGSLGTTTAQASGEESQNSYSSNGRHNARNPTLTLFSCVLLAITSIMKI